MLDPNGKDRFVAPIIRQRNQALQESIAIRMEGERP